MSPTSTNRSPRHRLTEVPDSDFEAVKRLFVLHPFTRTIPHRQNRY
ncbi:MAG: hypothetical protein K2H04_02005 [Bacteroidaceae bacterium]|nr:hypothetical protein [Bacteroidaceae bacterium]